MQVGQITQLTQERMSCIETWCRACEVLRGYKELIAERDRIRQSVEIALECLRVGGLHNTAEAMAELEKIKEGAA